MSNLELNCSPMSKASYSSWLLVTQNLKLTDYMMMILVGLLRMMSTPTPSSLDALSIYKI